MLENLTPMMRQYCEIKEQHKDHVLFYRLGDFYEMFFDDAILASKELELTLTGRDCGLEEKAPMAGIPYHSAEGYIAKLIKKGYKVAVCEQMEDASQAKGLVVREVVRVITPGTLLENNLLDEGINNFLCCIYAAKDGYGLAFADISTGQINLVTTSSQQKEVINELTGYFPREIVFNPEFVDKKEIVNFLREKLTSTADLIEEEFFETNLAKKSVLKHFNTNSLDELGLKENRYDLNALGGLLHYLKETQKTGIERLINLSVQKQNAFMNLDYGARTNLELTETLRTKEKRGSLLWVLDKTKTSLGKRLIRRYIYQPLMNPSEIDKRLNAVEELYKNELLMENLRDNLSGVHDIERILTRIVHGSAGPREYKTLEQTLKTLPELKKLFKTVSCENLKTINSKIYPLEELTVYLEKAIKEEPPATIKDGGVIGIGFDVEVDELRDLVSNVREHLAKLEAKEREITGIKNLKVGYNRVFGYYFEVTRSYLELVPEHYIRKQTLANNERYITQDLKELEDKIFSANSKILALEVNLFEQIRINTVQYMHQIQSTANAIAELDIYLSFATVSVNSHYVRPTVNCSERIDVKEGRHPVVEKVLRDVPFVPNNTILDTNENQISVITGPNMAGKSTFMRQTALIVLMAQIGCFVPAESASIGIVDGIYTRIGASDDLTSGESTFMVEMREVAEILKNATQKSLLILDEIGRGTSTYDGMSIARAVIEYISDSKKLGAKTLFATHYHELTIMETEISKIKNYHIVAKKRGGDIIFLRRIVRGGTDDSYGIEVSKLAGVPTWIVNRAYDVLKDLEENKPIIANVSSIEIEDSQVSFGDISPKGGMIIEKLEKLDINTLSPIEALNILHEIKQIQNS